MCGQADDERQTALRRAKDCTFWTAIVAFTVCVVVTIAVILLSPAPEQESLQGLVYSLTPRLNLEQLRCYRRPEALAAAVLLAALVLNVCFF